MMTPEVQKTLKQTEMKKLSLLWSKIKPRHLNVGYKAMKDFYDVLRNQLKSRTAFMSKIKEARKELRLESRSSDNGSGESQNDIDTNLLQK